MSRRMMESDVSHIASDAEMATPLTPGNSAIVRRHCRHLVAMRDAAEEKIEKARDTWSPEALAELHEDHLALIYATTVLESVHGKIT